MFQIGALIVLLFGILILVSTHSIVAQRVTGWVLIAVAILVSIVPGVALFK